MIMAAGVERYVRWSAKRKAILWIVVAVLVGVAYYFLGFKPKQEELAQLNKQSAQLAEEIQQKQAVAANLKAVKQAVAQMDALLKEALKKLPSGEEIPALLTKISDLARSSALESHLFRPLKPRPIEFYAEIPLQMEEHGGFYDLARFFDKVGRLPRIVTIEEIAVTTKEHDKDNNPLLKAKFTATTFQYLPPEKRPKKDTKNKKKRGRK